MIKLKTDFFDNLYLKAKFSFNECILNPENDYLKNEINIQMDEIILVEDFIRVQFFKDEMDEFIIEVKLLLTSRNDHLLGRYFYYEDEKGTPLNDSLVFD